MTWLLVTALTIAVFSSAAVLYRGRAAHRRCPTCHVDYEVVAEAGEGPNETYDVLACPRCANTATLVHGARTHLAYCPACANRSLETASSRVAGGGRKVEVREKCHLCAFERVLTVGAGGELGKVIPFPQHGRRKRDGSTGEP